MDRLFPKVKGKDQLPLDIEKILKDIKKVEKSSKMYPPVSQSKSSKAPTKRFTEQASMSISSGSQDGYYSSEFEDDEGSDTTSSRKRDDDVSWRNSASPGTSDTKRKKIAFSVNRVESTQSRELTYFDKDISLRDKEPPRVSAICWVVADANTGELICGRRENLRREIASLTKVMTCYAVCKLIKEFNIQPKSVYIQVSRLAASMTGTSARLNAGDVLSIWDLLHALMLPSGNDAAMCLAESFGTYIYMQSEDFKQKVKRNPDFANYRTKNGVRYFLNQMNKTAAEFDLTGTKYENPHGLMCKTNRSTAADIAKLAAKALMLDDFREIVNKKTYKCMIEQANRSEKEVTWENTNKLLWEGWSGVKTGNTPTAGPCFTGCVQIESQNYLVVVLGCNTAESRFTDCKKLVNWVHTSRKLTKS